MKLTLLASVCVLIFAIHSCVADPKIDSILNNLEKIKTIEHYSEQKQINENTKDTIYTKYYYQIHFDNSDSVIFGDFINKINDKSFNIYNINQHIYNDIRNGSINRVDLNKIEYWRKINVNNPSSILDIYQILKKAQKDTMKCSEKRNSIEIFMPYMTYWNKIETDSTSFVKCLINFNNKYIPTSYEITTKHDKDTIKYISQFKDISINVHYENNHFSKQNALVDSDPVEFVNFKQLKIGDQVPDWRYTFFEENEINKLYDNRDSVVLIEFWMVNCYYCIKSIPHLKELNNKYRDKAFKLIYLNAFNGDSNAEIMQFVKKYKINFKVARFSSMATGYTFPCFLLIDQSGNLQYLSLGYGGDKMMNDLDKSISRLLNQ